MTFLMCHLKSLIFDCLSFTEGLITFLSTADSEAPASTRNFISSVFPNPAALCRGVMPLSNKYKTIFKHKQFLINSSQTTQLYTTRVFYKLFSCHHYISNHFLSQIFLKLTFSDSVQAHD